VGEDDVRNKIGHTDGSYTDSVKKFQKENNLDDDGIVGPKTLRKLYKNREEKPAEAPKVEKPAEAPKVEKPAEPANKPSLPGGAEKLAQAPSPDGDPLARALENAPKDRQPAPDRTTTSREMGQPVPPETPRKMGEPAPSNKPRRMGESPEDTEIRQTKSSTAGREMGQPVPPETPRVMGEEARSTERKMGDGSAHFNESTSPIPEAPQKTEKPPRELLPDERE
jgi:hypothetical protein